tara:strand:- start:3635 stop:4183 length:549 start_codon:yes stop_codon:yes gene_type:complete|eukprot:scaffold52654_cov75-Phaeocystis_antarctica.AAC.3
MKKQWLLASRSWIHQEGRDGVAWEERAHRLQHPWQPIEPRGDCEVVVHGWARWDLTQLLRLHLGAEGRRRRRRSSGAVGTDVSRIAGAGRARIAGHTDAMPGAMRSAHRLGAGVAPPAALAAAHPDVAAVPVTRARVDARGPARPRHAGGGKEHKNHAGPKKASSCGVKKTDSKAFFLELKV